MKYGYNIWLLIGELVLAFSQLVAPVESAEIPIPACRVTVPDAQGPAMSHGSGVLFSQSDESNYILTNHHVVRDGRGVASVLFYRSEPLSARVVASDPKWDVAILQTRRGDVEPLPLAESAPVEGQVLMAGGFGPSNSWRAIRGRLTNFIAPGQYSQEFEMFDIEGMSRQGDSGGPVVTEDGKLAGILWGSAGGKTSATPVSKVVALCQRYGLPCGPCRGGVCPMPQQRGGGGVIVNVKPPGNTAMPIVRPPAQPPASPCKCDPSIGERLVKLEKIADKVEEVIAGGGIKGEKGEQGDQGIPGPAGQPATVDTDEIVSKVVDKLDLDEKLKESACKCSDKPATQPTERQHVVIVADQNAPYWQRLSEKINTAKQTYHGIQTTSLPKFPIGAHPQAVVYKNSVPVRIVKGQYAVEDLLSRLARNESI